MTAETSDIRLADAMERIYEPIHLQVVDCVYTHSEGDVYLVKEGRVGVYLLPWSEEAAGRRLLIGELTAGYVVPSCCFADAQGQQWRFVIVALEEATLYLLKGRGSQYLQNRFLENNGVDLRGETFTVGLREYYKREQLKDRIYFYKEKKNRGVIQAAARQMIRQALDEKPSEEGDIEALYRAVLFACKKTGIAIAPYSQVLTACGNTYGVADIARLSHFLCRKTLLTGKWYERDCGTFISEVDGVPVAVVRSKRGYLLYRSDNGRCHRLRSSDAAMMSPHADVIEPALPDKSLGKNEIRNFLKGGSGWGMFFFTVTGVMTCFLLAILIQALCDSHTVWWEQHTTLANAAGLLVFVAVRILFRPVAEKGLILRTARTGHRFRHAVCYRTFHLPAYVLREHDRAELAQRLVYAGDVCADRLRLRASAAAASAAALLYLPVMAFFSFRLTLAALGAVAVYVCVKLFVTQKARQWESSVLQKEREGYDRLYQMLCCVEAIKMTGAEDRAVLSCLKGVTGTQRGAMKEARWLALRRALESVKFYCFAPLLYAAAFVGRPAVPFGSLAAFICVFAFFTVYIDRLTEEAAESGRLRDEWRMLRPVLSPATEHEGKYRPEDALRGEISLSHVSFGYGDTGALLLDDLSLHIHSGEYVGIVGSSGCGKSTIFRLLLGFERLKKGQILYDGYDMATLDPRWLRGNISAVLQDGKLMAGSISDNITVGYPEASPGEIDSVINLVGLKEEIDAMPMRTQTLVTENGETLSGGQRQKILIARAVIRRPSVLLLDEATSALDYLSQKKICDELSGLTMTRIVIAHRLSTVKSCDRIVVLDQGRIAESGTYQELIEKQGVFYQMAKMQRGA